MAAWRAKEGHSVKVGKKGRGLRYMYRYLRLGDRDDVFWDQASTSTASSS